jgi:hypothetical protein
VLNFQIPNPRPAGLPEHIDYEHAVSAGNIRPSNKTRHPGDQHARTIDDVAPDQDQQSFPSNTARAMSLDDASHTAPCR